MPEAGIPDEGRGYRPIRDYAAIGDCHGAALVATDGAIDWCCLARFDADPVFCRLLDAARGGYTSLRPRGPYTAARQYLPDTNILRTEFRTGTGRVAITDFMPVGRKPGASVHDYVSLDAPGWIVRQVEVLEGSVDLELRYRPSAAFARDRVVLQATSYGVSGGDGLVLRSDIPTIVHGDTATGVAPLRAGARACVVIGKGADTATMALVERYHAITRAYWREWLRYCRYTGPYAQAVRRSALALKLMTYAPTGASVAAATTSLPEAIGGSRNWDYRYCWVRDATLMLQALSSLGYSGEAQGFYDFLRHTLDGPVDALQVLYGIGGERDLAETDVAHLAGYRGSRPVRTGNAACHQRQTDLYGYVLESMLMYRELGAHPTAHDRRAVERIVDFIEDCFPEADMGLWETRGAPRHYVHSKAMCWVVVDRAIRLFGERDDWVALRARMLRDILERGRAADGHFLQAYPDGRETGVDAALLQLAAMALPAEAESFSRTRIAVERELRDGDFVRRYRTADGLDGEEGAFLVCSFWLVDALLCEGVQVQAQALFERLLGHANDVGLYAEEIDRRSGAFLGNFPQAFTHLGLVGAAVNLELFRKHGVEGVRGTYAQRARRAVGATFGWRAVVAALLHGGRYTLRSSRRSQLRL